MTRRFSSTFALASAALVAPAALAQTLALYTFDDGTARDLSGSGLNALSIGGTPPVFIAGGWEGGGVQFDGSNALRVNLDINPTVRPRLTIGGWVRSTNITPTRHFISHDNQGYDRDLCIDTRGGGSGWSAFKGTGVLGFAAAVANQWQFVAAVYDDAASSVLLYVDGQVRTGTGRPGAGNTFLYIGRSTCCDAGIIGAADGVFILGEALSTQRLDEIMAGGIRKVPTCPVVFTPPESRPFCPNATATFTVDAGGAGVLSYRWQRETAPGSGVYVNLADGPTWTGSTLAGVYTPVFEVRNLGGLDVARYRCVVTNACGGVESSPAAIALCVADLDDGGGSGACDGGVTIDDLLYYLTLFADGGVHADVDDGTSTGARDGGVTIEDLLYYLYRYDVGC